MSRTTMRSRRAGAVWVPAALILSIAPPLAAQEHEHGAGREQYRVEARRVAQAPVIDGVLDERVWRQAVPITEFVQAEPVEGQPASEKTEVRVLYDDRAIYIGVICYDSDPSDAPAGRGAWGARPVDADGEPDADTTAPPADKAPHTTNATRDPRRFIEFPSWLADFVISWLISDL